MNKLFLYLSLLLFAQGTIAQDNLFAEKIILNTDKNILLEQGVITVSGYIFSMDNYKLSDLSGVVHLKLLNEKQQLVFDKRIKSKEGIFNESIKLPESVSSGKYYLVAYTNWMLNFPQIRPSIQPIRVYPRETTESQQNNNNQSLLNIEYFLPSDIILAEHFNTVVFESNHIIESGGFIIKNEKDTIATITSINQNLAYARFYCQSEEDRYQARFNDKIIRLPHPQKQGSIIDMNGIRLDSLRVNVKNGTESKGTAELQVLVNDSIKLNTMLDLSIKQIQLNLPMELLSKGLIELRILQKSSIIASALYYNSPIFEKATFTITEDEVKQQESPNIYFSLQDTLYVSTHIQHENLFNYRNESLITDRLFLFSNLNQQHYNGDVEELLSNHLELKAFLIKENRKLSQTRYEENKEFYPIEKNAFSISGRLKSPSTEDLNEITIICTLNGKQNEIFATKTDSIGNFQFFIPDFTGSTQVLIKPYSEQISTYVIELKENEVSENLNIGLNHLSISNEELISLQQWENKSDLVKRSYNTELLQSKSIQQERSTYLSTYTKELKYSDYILLNDFEEIARELLGGVEIKGKKNQTIKLRTYDKMKGIYLELMDDSPLILIDGVPVIDHSKVLNLKPKTIDYIRLINHEIFISGFYYDGLMEISTKRNSYFETESKNVLNFKLEGYSHTYDQEVEKSMDRFPAIEYILNAGVDTVHPEHTVIKGKATDIIGPYEVIIEGTDGKGKFYSGSTSLTIQPKQ